jgi:hypothetical protein
LRLLQICREYGWDRPFDIVYGSPYCAWAGGRPSAVTAILDERQIDSYFAAYAEYGVRCALTLSRLEVPEDSYDDRYCNILLDHIERYDGQAILFDDGLALFLRQQRPSINLVASLNKAMSDLKDTFAEEEAYYRKHLEVYSEVVIRCETALDPERLARLIDIHDRVEVITNQFCVPECKNVYRHVKALQDWNDEGCRGPGQPCFSLNVAANIDQRLSRNLFISDTRINELCTQGFTRLKLAGRNSPLPGFLDMLANYIFEPTGVILHIKSALLREYRQTAMATGGRLAQYSLPW